MPENRGKNRGWPGRSANNGVPGVKPLGTVRRSQVITTYGIGAIVDLEDGSFMPTGLEDWARATRFASLSIAEPGLEAQLGVSHFRGAPIMDVIPNSKGMVDPGKTTPAVRFPKWHECPKCHRLGTEGAPFEPDMNRLRCNGCKVTVNPVRFVLACDRGHIADFPWSWWAHRSISGGACDRPILFLKSHGASAALADLYVECRNCRDTNSLAGEEPRYVRHSLGDAFGAKTFEGKLSCRGSRPWLHDHQDCSALPRALQRGASNVHFGVVASALSIPPASRPAFQAIEELMVTLRHVPESARMEVIRGFAQARGFDPEDLFAAYESSQSIRSGEGIHTEAASRTREYKALCMDANDESYGGFVSHFQNRVRDPEGDVGQWFDLIGAASRLREVRALAGFSRIEPYPVTGERVREAIREGRISPLSASPLIDWLPAAEILGEGIFLCFRGERIAKWIQDNPELVEHARSLDDISAGIACQRGYERDYEITPRLLLIHSFAHALIRQLSLDCGYSMSALRERLFVTEAEEDTPAIHGVLIYTGSPDSDGSLGGLVRIADPGLLEEVILRTIAGAQWCGSDPVCIETDPAQAGERVSGAACHSCLLLPETACEKFNRELDRAVLVGHPEGSWVGYFQV